MTRIAVLLACGLALAGCATGRWVLPPGMTRQQAAMVEYQCEAQARAAYPRMDYDLADRYVDALPMIHRCYQAHGVRWVPD